jgi:NAD(P)-dependent dehydrogenase (short-subunit alcohol dehydrogenase family)
MDLQLTGRRALVTGASEGLGRAVVLALAEEGCDVAFCARRADALEQVADDARRVGSGRFVPIPADVSKLGDIQRCVEQAVEAFGGVDILVNNAGASGFGRLFEVPDERWLPDIELKMLGYVRFARELIPHMPSGGRVVNVAGNGGRQPLRYHLPGGVANAGILNFTGALAQEVAADGIHVIAVAPGPIRTARLERVFDNLAEEWGTTVAEAEERYVEALPLKRVPSAEEVAGVIVFLASDRAAYMTGTTVTIDGGITAGI